MLRTALLASLLALAPAARSEESQPPADVIIVVGAAGEESFGEAFATWADRWKEVAANAGAHVTRIGPEQPAATGLTDSQRQSESPLAPPGRGQGEGAKETSVISHRPPSAAAHTVSEGQHADEADEATDHQRLREAIAALDGETSAPVWIVMMGHGTFSQSVAKFNLVGPDVSADELAHWVQGVTRPLVVINAFSSSSPFINALSGEDRVIVTATRSGNEQNYSRFGDYLSQAIGDESADIDHDGEVSILEAFLAASAAVRDFYKSSGRIATEHALIDDNGDGLGTPATAFRGTRVVAKTTNPEQTFDGALAARITLASVSSRLSLTDQERTQRDEIEAELARLRARRDRMAQDDYQDAVLPLLIRLARIYQAAEEREKSQ